MGSRSGVTTREGLTGAAAAHPLHSLREKEEGRGGGGGNKRKEEKERGRNEEKREKKKKKFPPYHTPSLGRSSVHR